METFRRLAPPLTALLTALVVVAAPGAHATGRVLHVSPSGADGAACTEAAPCRSFDAAFDRAAGGDRVLVHGGTYPTQTISGGRAGRVTIAAAPGQSALIA